MQKITPHFWYDKKRAFEAAEFYTGLFSDARIVHTTIIPDTPSGDVEWVQFALEGQLFEAIGGGPWFRFNPALSLIVECETEEEVHRLWNALIEGGQELMPLAAYPFAKQYGWLADRYGLNWQLMREEQRPAQKIVPNLLFSGPVNGRAEEAVRFYTDVFPESSVVHVNHYSEGEVQAEAAKANFIVFTLAGQDFTAMDNGMNMDYTFTEAFSLMVRCKDQQELDAYWNALSAEPDAEQCGWLKDRFGVSWQIVPDVLDTLMTRGTHAQRKKVNEALLQMKKLDIAALEAAWRS